MRNKLQNSVINLMASEPSLFVTEIQVTTKNQTRYAFYKQPLIVIVTHIWEPFNKFFTKKPESNKTMQNISARKKAFFPEFYPRKNKNKSQRNEKIFLIRNKLFLWIKMPAFSSLQPCWTFLVWVFYWKRFSFINFTISSIVAWCCLLRMTIVSCSVSDAQKIHS